MVSRTPGPTYPEPSTENDAAGWLRLALEAAGASAWEWDIANDQVAWTESQYDLFGADPAQMRPSYEGFLALVHPDDRARVAAYVSETVATRRERHEQEFRVVRPDGAVRHLLSRARLVLDAAGQPGRLVGIDVDITERKRLEEALRQSEMRFRMVLAHSPVVVFAQDHELRYTWIFNSLVGWRIADIVGKTDADLLSPDEVGPLTALKRRVLATGAAKRGEIWITRDGAPVVCDLYLEPVRDGDGGIVGVVGTGTDVTERKRLEQQLERAATRDPLTDLPNRAMFRRELERALARVRRREGAVGVMLIDLDRFKDVNDSYGHATGDQLLVEVARRLCSCVREGDQVARLGGDEFAIIAECREGDQGCAALAHRVVERVSERVRLREVEVSPGVSVGLTVASCGTDAPDELLVRADHALYAAKSAGRGRWVTFDDVTTPHWRSRPSWPSPRALAANWFAARRRSNARTV